MTLKKGHILILSLILLILTMSYASAADNDTNIIKEQNQDFISINNEENDTISISNEEAETIGVIVENSTAELNDTNDSELLGSAEDNEVLTIQTSEDVLSIEMSATPIDSSSYKTPTKKQRTFTIGGFKAILTQSQYKKLYKATGIEDEFFDDGYYNYYYVGEKFRGYGISSTGLWHSMKVKTNKYVKVKVKIGNKYKIKKTRVYMQITYGAGQCGVPYRYMAFLTHKYNNPGYDYAKVQGKNAKYFTKCKHSTSLTRLNKAMLSSQKYVYRTYSVY